MVGTQRLLLFCHKSRSDYRSLHQRKNTECGRDQSSRGFNPEDLRRRQISFLNEPRDYQFNPASSYSNGRVPIHTVPYQQGRHPPYVSRGPSSNYHRSGFRGAFPANNPNPYQVSVPRFIQPGCYGNQWPIKRYNTCEPSHKQWCAEGFEQISYGLPKRSPTCKPFRKRQCAEEEFEQISHGLQNLSLKSCPEKEILNIFQQLGRGKSLTARNIARKLKITKKEANRCLYKLKLEGRLSSQGERPPLWSIAVPSVTLSLATSRTTKVQEAPPCNLRKSTDSYVEHSGKPIKSVHIEGTTEACDSCTTTYTESSTDDEDSSISSDEIGLTTMVVNKEKIYEYLFGTSLSTASIIAKSIGLSRAKDVNITLYQMEKQGEICRESGTSPPKWSLTDKKRERMLLKKKAHEVLVSETTTEDGLTPSLELESESRVALGKDAMNGTAVVQVEAGLNALTEPPTKRMKIDALNGSFATDDIPEGLNSIGKNATSLEIMDKSLEPEPVFTPLEKLQQAVAKNPVSGLMEYTQFMSQKCDFVLLQQTGPSHDPRFKIQAIIEGRQFPAAVAANKKIAKQEAANNALKILVREAQGEEGIEVLPVDMEEASVDVVVTPAPKALPTGKNPISVLMESAQRLGKTCEFKLTSQDGPAHDPKFTFVVHWGEQVFASVTASSKKLAKQLAAEAAVKELSNQSGTFLFPEKEKHVTSESLKNNAESMTRLSNKLTVAASANVGNMIKYLNANPVSGLMEYSRANGFAAEFKLVEQTGPSHDPKFIYQAKVGGRWFPAVTANSKKQGKQEAADAALRMLIGESEKAERTGERPGELLPVSGSTFHDQIAMLSHQCFNTLTARIQHSLLGRKILAAIVMRASEDDMGTVVSIGTGNRCVKGEELSLNGETVNDCHAEVISRRGFIRYLYSELMKYDENSPESSIFEYAIGGKLKVKDSVTFHLYISTAPCGDGALFDKSNSDPPADDGDTTHHPLFENPKQGKLRTKVENGEGTIPVESSDIVPTWDGIQHGERLRTMSCSDKILRWNVLGLQGALLSNFTEPVYLATITLGYLYSQGHLTRALCCRMSKNGDGFQDRLPVPFILNHPVVGRVSVYDSTRQTGKTKESSVNWCLADVDVEVLDGTKGKIDGPQLDISRVSKRNMYLLFRELCRRYNRQDLLSLSSYNEAKEAAAEYTDGNLHFVRSLAEMGFGSWICKPQEEKTFTVYD